MTYLPIPQLTEKEKERIMAGFVENPNGCLDWQRCLSTNGYGKVTVQGVNLLLHRVMYYIHYGEDPAENLVLHECDRRICGRKEHLHLGTHQDNTREMYGRNRHPGMKGFLAKNPGIIDKWKAEGKYANVGKNSPLGEDNHFATLTADDVREIRRLASEGMSYGELGRQYGVTSSNISCIVRRISWKHIE